MWGTDLTATWTGEGQAAVFVAVDQRSAECVGIHAAAGATRFKALEPIRQGVRHHFGAFAKDVARGLSVRHDHGSQYMSDALEGLRLPRHREFARLRASTAGQWLRRALDPHLKENLLWVRAFDTSSSSATP
jgi:putative transposase